MAHRRFVLMRDEDVTGVSGTGVVAEGVHWTEADVVALRWTSAWPTSVVFHERGIASVEAVHGHGGKTRIVWLDPAESLSVPEGPRTEEQAVVEAARAWKAARTIAQEFDGHIARGRLVNFESDLVEAVTALDRSLSTEGEARG